MPRQRAPSPLDYASVKDAFERGTIGTDELAERLSDGWAAAYRAASEGVAELVEVDQENLTYLFDVAQARVVGVHGHSAPPATAYPRARMRGFPLPRSKRRLVRGHLAAHTVGGGTDINLIPQDAALNVSGAWRRLERWAQARPGAFLAVEVTYEDGGQTPAGFVYLVAASEGELHYQRFQNK